MPQKPGMTGAMCLYADSGDHVESLLPTAPVSAAVWETGPVIFPYLTATCTDDIVIVMLAPERVSFARLHRGVVHFLSEIESIPDDMRLAAVVARKLPIIAGRDSHIVIGGPGEEYEQLRRALSGDLASRCAFAPVLTPQMPVLELAECARNAMQDLLTARQLELLDSLQKQAHLTRRASFGIEAVAEAAAQGAVDRVIVSESLWQKRPHDVEVLMQQALRSSASVDVATPASAKRLIAEAGGIAASLRRAMPGSRSSGAAFPTSPPFK